MKFSSCFNKMCSTSSCVNHLPHSFVRVSHPVSLRWLCTERRIGTPLGRGLGRLHLRQVTTTSPPGEIKLPSLSSLTEDGATGLREWPTGDGAVAFNSRLWGCSELLLWDRDALSAALRDRGLRRCLPLRRALFLDMLPKQVLIGAVLSGFNDEDFKRCAREVKKNDAWRGRRARVSGPSGESWGVIYAFRDPSTASMYKVGRTTSMTVRSCQLRRCYGDVHFQIEYRVPAVVEVEGMIHEHLAGCGWAASTSVLCPSCGHAHGEWFRHRPPTPRRRCTAMTLEGKGAAAALSDPAGSSSSSRIRGSPEGSGGSGGALTSSWADIQYGSASASSSSSPSSSSAAALSIPSSSAATAAGEKIAGRPARLQSEQQQQHQGGPRLHLRDVHRVVLYNIFQACLERYRAEAGLMRAPGPARAGSGGGQGRKRTRQQAAEGKITAPGATGG